MTNIWHKRKKNMADVAYGAALAATIIVGAYVGLAKMDAYAVENQEVFQSRSAGCTDAEIVEYLSVIIEE